MENFFFKKQDLNFFLSSTNNNNCNNKLNCHEYCESNRFNKVFVNVIFYSPFIKYQVGFITIPLITSKRKNA